jgi:hypothetical protein
MPQAQPVDMPVLGSELHHTDMLRIAAVAAQEQQQLSMAALVRPPVHR